MPPCHQTLPLQHESTLTPPSPFPLCPLLYPLPCPLCPSRPPHGQRTRSACCRPWTGRSPGHSRPDLGAADPCALKASCLLIPCGGSFTSSCNRHCHSDVAMTSFAALPVFFLFCRISHVFGLVPFSNHRHGVFPSPSIGFFFQVLPTGPRSCRCRCGRWTRTARATDTTPQRQMQTLR